jgi:hypothetical protein
VGGEGGIVKIAIRELMQYKSRYAYPPSLSLSPSLPLSLSPPIFIFFIFTPSIGLKGLHIDHLCKSFDLATNAS